MATTIVSRGGTASKDNIEKVDVHPVSRREFLYYIWGASIALITGEALTGLIWFSLPRFKEGTFGGVVNFAPDRLPKVDQTPIHIPAARFWISNTQDGLLALYDVCTHLGCIPKWIDSNHRFECPCHGSKYQLNGHYIEGPAPRSLDRFQTTITFDDGETEVTDAAGDPLPIAGKKIIIIAVNTGKRILRNGRV